MKKYYTTLVLSLITLLVSSQGYKFGIVHISNYDFKIVAIPDFDSAGNTDVSDVGFTLMMPAGSADITNRTGLLGARSWGLTKFDAAILMSLGGDGTEDAFIFNLTVGQTIFSHTMSQQIDLVSFDVTNMPVTGQVRFLLNSETINAGGNFDSFYNSNIDATTTQDYFSGLAVGMESFDFSVLGIEDNILQNSIKIYPNPASDIIHISSSIEIEQIKMFDVLGKEVLSTNKTLQIKINHLQSGIYFLKIFGIEGSSATKKIIIE
jgi:hypothetical protein